jgi:hypothetical protein
LPRRYFTKRSGERKPAREIIAVLISERAGHAAAIYYSLVESCKANKVNPLTYLTYVLANARNKSITLPTPDEFTASNIAHVG